MNDTTLQQSEQRGLSIAGTPPRLRARIYFGVLITAGRGQILCEQVQLTNHSVFRLCDLQLAAPPTLPNLSGCPWTPQTERY